LGDTQLKLDGGGVKNATRYYTYNRQTIAQRSTTGVQFTTCDPHGTSTIAVTDNTTQVAAKRYQTPYGDPRGPNVTWTGTKTFVGGDQDPTGLIHEGAREYDPTLGRFTTIDPQFDGSDPQSWNGYGYADNNPVLNIDATGTCISIDGSGVCGSQLKSASRRKILNDYEARQHRVSSDEVIRSTSPCVSQSCYDACKYGGCGTDTPRAKAGAFAPAAKPKPRAKQPGIFGQMLHGAAHALRRTWQATRLVVNAPLTGAVVAVAAAGGASCGMDGQELTVVCQNAPRWMYGRGGTTLGGAFMTDKLPTDPHDRSRRLAHEAKHSDQWAIANIVAPAAGDPLFAAAYLTDEWASGEAAVTTSSSSGPASPTVAIRIVRD
jgi:RHS repeat-associated protein